MCLEKISQAIQVHVRDLGTYLWEEQPAVENTRRELAIRYARLDAEIGRRLNLASRFHTGLVELERRLARHEKSLADLLKRVKVYHRLGDRDNAWRHSLELEKLRQVVSHERSRLKVQEDQYRNQLAYVKRLKRRLALVDAQMTL
ncbi:MAG TPA: hypothetical protein VGX70_22980 [Gemmataceae bacterium]|nr:hypothetical protein [Gemmataceae bacterium]